MVNTNSSNFVLNQASYILRFLWMNVFVHQMYPKYMETHGISVLDEQRDEKVEYIRLLVIFLHWHDINLILSNFTRQVSKQD